MQVARARAVWFAAALGWPVAGLAESSTGTGQAALSASASVNFRIVIPQVLALNVAAGASVPASNALAPFSSVMRGARSATALPDQPAVTLRSNMRHITVIQDLRGQAVYTVIAP